MIDYLIYAIDYASRGYFEPLGILVAEVAGLITAYFVLSSIIFVFYKLRKKDLKFKTYILEYRPMITIFIILVYLLIFIYGLGIQCFIYICIFCGFGQYALDD